MRPLVSVVIPAWNRAATLGRALESVLAQERDDVDIVVVDDGSTDATAQVARKFGAGVRVLSQANAGPGAARNAGIRASRGELVAFLDADDHWLPGKLSAQIEMLEQQPELALVGSWADHTTPDGQLLKRYRPAPATEVDFFLRLCFENLLPTSSVLVRRECLEAAPPGFRTDLAPVEDWELWLRLAARFPAGVVGQTLIRYEVRPDSTQGRLAARNYLALYQRMFAGLRADPAAGPRLAPLWPDVEANTRLLAAYELHRAGRPWAARRLATQSLRLLRRPDRWKTFAGLCLPTGWRPTGREVGGKQP